MYKFLLLLAFILLNPAPSSAQTVANAASKLAPAPQLTARLSPSKNYLSLNFRNLSSAKSFTYEVNYIGNAQEQGVFGQVSKVKSNLLMRHMFLGTCSKKVCISHKNVNNLTVTARFTLKNGKVITRILTP